MTAPLLSFVALANAAEPFLVVAFALVAGWLLVMSLALRTGNAASKWEAFRREAQANEQPYPTPRNGTHTAAKKRDSQD